MVMDDLVVTCEDEADVLALRCGNLGKRLDCQANVLFLLEPVDAQDELFARCNLFLAVDFVMLDIGVDARVNNLCWHSFLQARPRLGHDSLCKVGVYSYRVRKAHAPFL